MVKIVQLARGDRANQDAYTGPEGELTSDTSTPELRLHDGVQAGGHRILPSPENDLRYQALSTELTAIEAVGTGPGYLVKRGNNDYRLRTLTGTTGEITITNGNGFDGNPVVSLPDTITPTLTFSGVVTFSQSILGNLTGNVTGNLTGNSAGTHTGAVVGNVTGDLTGNAAGSHTGTFTGNLDTSGGTVNFAAGQIPDAALASTFVKPTDLFLVPAGGIILWSGLISAIPSGWLLCDGTFGTPDLRDRFVVGAGTTYSEDDTGGAVQHTHGAQVSDSQGAHTHAVTVDPHALTEAELAAHEHFVSANVVNGAALSGSNSLVKQKTTGGDGDYVLEGTVTASTIGKSSETGSGTAHSHTGSTASDGAHTHTTPNPAVDNLPPYYALAYIMKS